MLTKLKTLIRVNLDIMLGRSPKFKIQKKIKFQKIGGENYGHWNVNIDEINSNSIVYSFGVGTDISFDLELISKTNCTVYAFDPTPQSIEFVNSIKSLPPNFIFQPYGIANYNGKAKFFKPSNDNYVSHSITNNQNTKKEYIEVDVKTIHELMKINHHESLDIVKMDIEGAEYEVIPDILKFSKIIKQLLVEFHHRYFDNGKELTLELVSEINQAGYSIYSISDSNEELSFIK
jgi:FkbM family methyltransferase